MSMLSAAVAAHEPSAGGTRGRLTEALSRIRAEYNEMPGLCLTSTQAERLLGLETHECTQLFAALLDVGYLRRSSRGFVKN